MVDEALFQFSQEARTGGSQWVATFVLVTTILLTLSANAAAVPGAVGLCITGTYGFTALTSFANPAVTIARGLSDTFAGIDPTHVPVFIGAQLVGAVCATVLHNFPSE